MDLLEKQEAGPALCWLLADDNGGGIASVVETCCNECANLNTKATILMLATPGGHISTCASVQIYSLASEPPHKHAPKRFAAWLRKHQQDVLFINGCDEADPAIPYLNASTRVVYVVHDTAERYFSAAVRFEPFLDAVVAVSQNVAEEVRKRLKQPDKLHVITNGSSFPLSPAIVVGSRRDCDIIFLGGDNLAKGSHDVCRIWIELQRLGFTGRLHWLGSMRPSFEMKVRKLPASEKIVKYGRVSRDDVFRIAARCKVSLMMSRGEPFGMATVECVAMGCTPVAWDIPSGTQEIVCWPDGYFIRRGDYRSAARSILTALQTHSDVLSKRTFKIHSLFSGARMAVEYRQLALHLLSKPPATRPYADHVPADYTAPKRLFQLIPEPIRRVARQTVGRSVILGYWLRNVRGF